MVFLHFEVWVADLQGFDIRVEETKNKRTNNKEQKTKPLFHEGFGHFWDGKPLWNNGLCFAYTLQTKNTKKPPKLTTLRP